MVTKKTVKTVLVVVGIAAFCLCVFVVTYSLRSKQLDNYVSSLGNAVEDEVQEEAIDISAIKVGYEGKTYTLTEFVELDELPVIVDVLIAQKDGTITNKQAYVSFDDSDTDNIKYIDGVYGRLILPQRYNKE